MYSFLKNHFFGMTCVLIFGLYFGFLTLIFFAPHRDVLERGFIPCTRQMMQELTMCQKNKISCTFKLVIKNNICDFKVVKKGFDLWLEGKAPTPWSHYYFTPTLDEPNILEDEALKDYYQNNPNIAREMEELNQKAIEFQIREEQLKNEEKPQ